MLKETETEKASLFCHIFIIGGISIGGACPLPPPGYAYDVGFEYLVTCDPIAKHEIKSSKSFGIFLDERISSK